MKAKDVICLKDGVTSINDYNWNPKDVIDFAAFGIKESKEWYNPDDNNGIPDEFCITRIESGYWEIAFNRTPDTEGLGFWIKSLDNGNSLNNVSQGFIGSPEFQRTYGANSSDTTFLTNIYTNVLGRNYDQSGYDFWLNGLKNGLQRDSLLSQFSESVENCANVAPLIGQGIQYKEYLG
jgi:hypothetical protein